MATDTKTIKATCLCSAAAHEITVPTSALPFKASICSCHSCRHLTGTLALTCSGVPKTYSPSQELLDKLTPFAFSNRVTFHHCTTCGSQLLFNFKPSKADRANGSIEYWDIISGSLEQIDGVVDFEYHEHIADTIDGGFSDFLPSINGKELKRWPHDPHADEELPLYWQSEERPKVEPSPSDRLHCHCKCGGVEFWIARPSERSKNAASEWPDVIIPYHSSQPRTDKSEWWLRDGGKKFLGGVCACNSCRLDAGCEWVEWAFVPTVDVSLDAEGKKPYDLPFGSPTGWGTLKGYNSSPRGPTRREAWRYHCATCGAMVFFTCDERTDLIDIGVGVLDAPEGARAETWLGWWTDRLSFREDAIPRAKEITLAVEDGMKKFGAKNKA